MNNLRGDRLSEKEGARTAYSDDPSVGGCQVTNDGMEVNSVIMLTPDGECTFSVFILTLCKSKSKTLTLTFLLEIMIFDF